MKSFVDYMGPLENENNVSDSEEDKLETASESSDKICDLAICLAYRTLVKRKQ